MSDLLEEPLHEEVETYGDPGVTSADGPIPLWLWATYIIMPIGGLIAWVIFWNGSVGFLDRGYWEQLQKAANTKFPEIREKEPQFDANQ